jgi:type IV secretory pathway TrbD component
MAYGIGPLEVLIVLTIVGQVPALVIAGMKGRWVWFAFGLLLWIPAFVGALLPARADSTWAIRRSRKGS